ncbi:MAG: flavodoxin-dependent (E)-4-hydroxy-3-methylbut-2-enyl-diphosphate synthase [bacterium]|nr:flavodoxin-dependent (E)-4-hydroxy-3-methylbut-2-enyl-diphosphate synthase [bacterium]
MHLRQNTKKILIGDCEVGGGAPVRVETMTKTDTGEVSVTVAQIESIAAAGGEMIRIAVPDIDAAGAFGEIVNRSPLPVIADIHFDYRLALACLDAGVACIRLNPGNITRREQLAEVARRTVEMEVPVRVGVNAGSLDAEIYEKYGGPTGGALAESALNTVKLLEDYGISDFVISAKSTDVAVTRKANRLIAEAVSYPLHIGITEAGFGVSGITRSALGIGMILSDGIGDTIRVSLTEEPETEIEVGFEILRAVSVRRRGPTIISCPTCGRTEIDLMALAREVAAAVNGNEKDIHIAVMGCAVNGPGESREADIGIAGGKGRGVIYRKGEIVCTVPEAELVPALLKELDKL